MTTPGRPRPPDSLTTAEAAKVLGVSTDTVYLMWVDGRLRQTEPPSGRRPRFFDCAAVEAYAAERAASKVRHWHGLDLTDASTPLAARFWSKVDATGECWVWTEHCDKKSGYGQFLLRKGQPRLAHVVSYALTKGPVPPRLHVCHTCDNPPCVRPDHLFIGTAADNANDCVAKGRANRSRGADHRDARLNDEIVRVIRATPPHYGRLRELARRYGVSDVAIRHVLTGKTWRHVA